MVDRKPSAEHDIISDILQRIAQAQKAGQARLDAEAARRIEAEARAFWGGSRVVVRKHALTATGQIQTHVDRNSRIQRAYLDNKRLAEIARTEGVSIRRILQIVKTR